VKQNHSDLATGGRSLAHGHGDTLRAACSKRPKDEVNVRGGGCNRRWAVRYRHDSARRLSIDERASFGRKEKASQANAFG
jgi:hypothetical protein